MKLCPHCEEDCHLPAPRWTNAAYLAIMEAQGVAGYQFATCGRGRRADRELLGYNMVNLLTTRVRDAKEDAI